VQYDVEVFLFRTKVTQLNVVAVTAMLWQDNNSPNSNVDNMTRIQMEAERKHDNFSLLDRLTTP
jgi:hypothetical protein